MAAKDECESALLDIKYRHGFMLVRRNGSWDARKYGEGGRARVTLRFTEGEDSTLVMCAERRRTSRDPFETFYERKWHTGSGRNLKRLVRKSLRIADRKIKKG